MVMAAYARAHTPPSPSSISSCSSSLSKAFLRFKKDNEHIRADIEELKYKSRTLPRVNPRRVMERRKASDDPQDPLEEGIQHSSIPLIERKLDRLATLLEAVAINVRSQHETSERDSNQACHGCFKCPGCGVQYRLEEDTPSLEFPTANATLTNEQYGTAREEGDNSNSGELETAIEEEIDGETLFEDAPEAVSLDENGEREETESASAEQPSDDLQTQLRASNNRVVELEMKTSELLRMNYTWQEYFQIMTARMDDERFIWRLQLGELDRNVDSGPIITQLHERVGTMERERLEHMEKIDGLLTNIREFEEKLRISEEEKEELKKIQPVADPSPCYECSRLTNELTETQERCAWLTEKVASTDERCTQLTQERDDLIRRSDSLLAETETLREQLAAAGRRAGYLQSECEALRVNQAAMEAKREGDTSPTQLSQLGHMQTISAWNCPSCNCKNPPFTPMCHKCHRGQRPPPFNPYVLDRS